MKFSQRIGKTPIKSIIQSESVDEDLKNALWNGFNIYYLNQIQQTWISNCPAPIRLMLSKIWINHFKKRIDQEPISKDGYLDFYKDKFFSFNWFEIYDFIEFVPNAYSPERNVRDNTNNYFIKYCNKVLERELSAYRFIDGKIAQISSKEELVAIENALNIDDRFKAVKVHLSRSIELLSDRQNPDFRNSIKESISSIESFCCIITDSPKATLGQALKQIEKSGKLHSALKNSFTSLYGYTSDADGIRHALLEDHSLQQEDAIFMLVSCSSFINYLNRKIA